MFIEPLKCSACGRTGRPGEQGFQASGSGVDIVVHCDCKHAFKPTSPIDQQILSTNEFVRLGAASNYSEWGEIELVPGNAADIKFKRHFDIPCKAYFTPTGPIFVREVRLKHDQMTAISSMWVGRPLLSTPVKISWLIYGLVDLNALPTWYVHFYSAMAQMHNGFFKSALLDYAVCFESFIEAYLGDRLRTKSGAEVSDYLLRRTWRVEDRVKDLLQLAVGHRLSERDDVYQPWDRDVRDIRNRLTHGERIQIDQAGAERGHQAVYQAIRWIESLPV